MFCSKCGSIMMPKREGTKKLLACSCGYKSKDISSAIVKEEKLEKRKDIEVVDKSSVETLPLTEADCPQCAHKKAYFWLVQTRASDEPETKFLRCEKCEHTWRDYS